MENGKLKMENGRCVKRMVTGRDKHHFFVTAKRAKKKRAEEAKRIEKWRVENGEWRMENGKWALRKAKGIRKRLAVFLMVYASAKHSWRGLQHSKHAHKRIRNEVLLQIPLAL